MALARRGGKINCGSIASSLGNISAKNYQNHLKCVQVIGYFVNTPVPSVNYCDGLDRCILYCILFVFMLALLCFCVATVFSVNKD